MLTEMLGKFDVRLIAGFRRFWRDEAATTSLEYALVVALVSLSAIAGYQVLGASVGAGAGSEGIGACNPGSGSATEPPAGTGAAGPQ
jgi:Flp pilus assembly pilin Flp